MKKKIILAIAALLVFGLAIVAYAYQTGSSTPAQAACACCKGDSCPMMKKDGATADKTSCDCDCCRGDSCPMMKKGEHAATAGDHKDCDCPCCHHDQEKKDKPDA